MPGVAGASVENSQMSDITSFPSLAQAKIQHTLSLVIDLWFLHDALVTYIVICNLLVVFTLSFVLCLLSTSLQASTIFVYTLRRIN